MFGEHSKSVQLQSGATFHISKLKADLHGKKHWIQIGMITASGLALEPVQGLNGNTLFPLLHPKRPTLRVPVVLSPPHVSVQDPSLTETNEPCMGRALPCYKYDGGISTQQTKKLLCCFGSSIDFLKFLQRDLGFDTEIYIVPDGQFGKYDNASGNWSGIMNEIVSGKADMALDLSLNKQRMKVLEMAYPTVPTSLNILVKKEYSHSKVGMLVSVFVVL